MFLSTLNGGAVLSLAWWLHASQDQARAAAMDGMEVSEASDSPRSSELQLL